MCKKTIVMKKIFTLIKRGLRSDYSPESLANDPTWFLVSILILMGVGIDKLFSLITLDDTITIIAMIIVMGSVISIFCITIWQFSKK